MNNYVKKTGAQLINGVKTFLLLPECSVDPNTQYQLVNKKYVDSLPIYQTKSDMINYLTISSAIFIYQNKSNMVHYLLTSTATATYKPISLMTNYLTTATAAILY